jgi:hypothetical protein
MRFKVRLNKDACCLMHGHNTGVIVRLYRILNSVYKHVFLYSYRLSAFSCLEIVEVLAANSIPLTERLLAQETGT